MLDEIAPETLAGVTGGRRSLPRAATASPARAAQLMPLFQQLTKKMAELQAGQNDNFMKMLQAFLQMRSAKK